MAEDWYIDLSRGKSEAYVALRQGVRALMAGEPNRTANLANVTAAIQATFSWHWVGFYLVDETRDELVLGPFQGPVACTRLQRGKGVCAAAWTSQATVNVPDIEAFPGHVACSSLTRSELVVPVVVDGVVVAVLDIDSRQEADFDADDEAGMAGLVEEVENLWHSWS